MRKLSNSASLISSWDPRGETRVFFRTHLPKANDRALRDSGLTSPLGQSTLATPVSLRVKDGVRAIGAGIFPALSLVAAINSSDRIWTSARTTRTKEPAASRMIFGGAYEKLLRYQKQTPGGRPRCGETGNLDTPILPHLCVSHNLKVVSGLKKFGQPAVPTIHMEQSMTPENGTS